MTNDTYLDMNTSLPAGTLVDGRYRIVRVIGQGGFAVVYLAEHTSLGRQVALKVLDLTGNQRDVAMFRARFQREAKLSSQLDHTNVVRIHDFGFVSQNQQPYMAMELLEGHDLEEELVRFGPMTPARALHLFDGALAGLAAAHARGIVHKDLKPSNLFIANPGTPEERLVVLDFGIAHLFDDHEGRLTQTHQYTGTPAYAAPEYIDEQTVSPALDVYQMGLILGETLSGTPVVQASSPMAFLMAHCQGEQRLDSRLDNTPIASVLKRAVAVSPHERYTCASEFRTALSHVDPRTIPDLSGSGSVGPPITPTAHTAPPAQLPMVHVATQPMGQGIPSKLPLILGAIAAACLLLIVTGVGIISYALLVDDGGSSTTSVLPQEHPTPEPIMPAHPSLSQISTELQEALMEELNPKEWQKNYRKFAAIHQAQRFMSPIGQYSAPLYLEYRKLHENDPEFTSSVAPQDMRILFDSAQTQAAQVAQIDRAHEELDSHFETWHAQAQKLKPILFELNVYWIEDQEWQKDEGKAADAMDRRLKTHLAKYSKHTQALRQSMIRHEAVVLNHRKKMVGGKDSTGELAIIDALLALETLHDELTHDPQSKATREARAHYMKQYKRARQAAQRVEKVPGSFVTPGAQNHVDNMRTYNQYLKGLEHGLENEDERVAMLGHYNWLHAAYHDTFLGYYNQVLNSKKLEAIKKLGQ